MPISQGKTGEESLNEKFHNLVRDWESYMQSNPRHRRSRSAAADPAPDFLNLLCSSPKKLISSLQRSEPPSPSGGLKLMSGGSREAAEIAAERRAALRSGRIPGRKLLDDLERATDEVGFQGKEEICSVCSSALIQGSEVGSTSCSCCSSSIGRDVGYYAGFSSSSLSSVVSLEEDRVRVRVSGGDGGKWTVRMAWVLIVVVVLALGVMSLSEFGVEEYGEYVIPT